MPIFSDNAHRMVGGGQDFQDPPGNFPVALDGLVRIGVGAMARGAHLYRGLASSRVSSAGASGLAINLVLKSRPADRPKNLWVGRAKQ
jgi:hypothetical protein